MPQTPETTVKEQQQRYLAAMAKTGTQLAGCRAARCSHNTVARWRAEDAAVLVQEHQAKSNFADELEEEAIRRAWHGTKKPGYQGKELVGYIQEYSDVLLIFALKAVRPDKYRERVDVRTSRDEPVVVPMRQEDIAKV